MPTYVKVLLERGDGFFQATVLDEFGAVADARGHSPEKAVKRALAKAGAVLDGEIQHEVIGLSVPE